LISGLYRTGTSGTICGKHFGREEAEVEKGLNIDDDIKRRFRCLGASNGEYLYDETAPREWKMEAKDFL